MKKFICIGLSLIFFLSLCACKNGTKDTAESSAPSSAAAAAVSDVISESPSSAVSETPSSEPETPEVQPTVHVTGISLSAYEKTLNVGQRFMPIVTMQPSNATDKGEIWVSDNTNIAKVNRYGNITALAEGQCNVTVTSADNSSVSAVFNLTVTAPPPAPPEAQPTYINGVLIVNKSYPLPKGYTNQTNPQATAEAQNALNAMFAAAANEGHTNMRISSGYRSYATQSTLYNRYVKRDGQAAADRYSARPGYSEHQTGLAFDIIKAGMTSDPATLSSWSWLAENAHNYGFILRYPEGKESVTGYQSEPWHYRYVGIELAQKVHASGLTLEEYFGITSVYAQ